MPQIRNTRKERITKTNRNDQTHEKEKIFFKKVLI